MVSSQFETILKDLEAYFNYPLKVDERNACSLKLKSGMEVQMEMDRYENFVIAIRLATIPASRYRENVLKEALRMNHIDAASKGIFGYGTRNNRLILFLTINQPQISQNTLLALVPPFIIKGQSWFDPLQRGEVPIVETNSGEGRPNIFGIK